MDIFEKLKKATSFIPFKDQIRPLYGPLLNKLKYNQTNKNFNESGKEVLIKASKVLNSIGVMHWLEFGTLLGITRDGQLIKHDLDLDLGVFIEDYDEKIKKAFIADGFEYKHGFTTSDGSTREDTFFYKKVAIDIFYFSKKADKMCCHIFDLQEDNTRVIRQINTHNSGFKKIKFENHMFDVPKDEIQRLKDTYGEEYNIPLKGWYTPRDAYNSEIIEKEIIYL